MEKKKRLLEISGVCGIRSVGRIAAEIAQDYEAQGWECKIAYGRLDVPEKYRDGILGYADFVRNMPSSPSLSKYGSYPDYLEAMVKKNKKKAKK